MFISSLFEQNKALIRISLLEILSSEISALPKQIFDWVTLTKAGCFSRVRLLLISWLYGAKVCQLLTSFQRAVRRNLDGFVI